MKRLACQRSRRGGALTASLVLVTLVSSLGALVIQTHIAHSRRDSAAVDAWRAFYVAEAGLSEALMALSQGRTGNVGTAEEPALFGDGVVWVEATSKEGGYFELKSTGAVGAGRQSLGLVVRPSVNPLTTLGVYAARDLIVGPGSVLDGYDSDVSEYEEQVDADEPVEAATGGIMVGSGNDVSIQSLALRTPDTFVFGDVHPGSEGSAVIDPGVQITGATSPSAADRALPMPDVPSILSKGSLTVSGGITSINGLQVAYESLEVTPGSALNITGPAQIVVGSLEVQAGASLSFDSTDGPIELFVAGTLNMAEGSLLQSTEGGSGSAIIVSTNVVDRAAARTAIEETFDGGDLDDARTNLATSVGPLLTPLETTIVPPILKDVPDTVDMNASGTFHGLIYAPLAPLTLPSELRVYGSVIAYDLDLEPGSRVTYDAAMESSTLAVSPVPTWLGWHVLPLPDEAWVQTGLDPVMVLRIAGASLVDTRAAHEEDWLAIDYLDGRGGAWSYDGPSKDFNAGRVDQIVAMSFYDPDLGPAPATLGTPPKTRTSDATNAAEVAAAAVKVVADYLSRI